MFTLQQSIYLLHFLDYFTLKLVEALSESDSSENIRLELISYNYKTFHYNVKVHVFESLNHCIFWPFADEKTLGGPFHQHFDKQLFVQKLFVQLLSTFGLGLHFGKGKLTKKLILKYMALNKLKMRENIFEDRETRERNGNLYFELV